MVTDRPLVIASDLDGFDGAPFSEPVVQAAAQAVRRLCGWHIAPRVTETVTLDHDGGRVLHLPSLHVVDVVAVRDVTGDAPRDLTGWRWSGAGMIEGAFPTGFRAVEVDLVHGYEECPPELLPVIARSAKRRVLQESLGSRSRTFENDAAQGESVLDSLRLGSRP